MNSLWIAAIVVVCLMAGALVGMALRAKLPEHHLSQDSMDVIKLATGLMATLAALVLGLLISSANSARSTVVGVVDQSVANAGLVDRYLAAYGPDTQQARELLRHIVIWRAQVRWPAEDFGPPEPRYLPIATTGSSWRNGSCSWRRGTRPRNGSRVRRCSSPTRSPSVKGSR